MVQADPVDLDETSPRTTIPKEAGTLWDLGLVPTYHLDLDVKKRKEEDGDGGNWTS